MILKLRPLALSGLAAITVFTVACGGGADAPRPNILLISADTLRFDHVGANGYPRATTPTIDALAARGVNFTHAYSHAPQTAMSHTSLLTSLYPSVHGVFEHGQEPDPSLVTLPEALQGAGYATAAFTQLNGRTFEPGFDNWHYIESELESNKGLTDLGMLTDWVGDQQDPWFVFLHSYDVHLPYSPEDEYVEMWAPDYDGVLDKYVNRKVVEQVNDGSLVTTERDRQFIVDLYDAELRRLDDIYGRLFADLEAMGVMEDTLIVFLSDHGEEFGEHGNWGRHSYTLNEELIRVPLIMAGPGLPIGQEVDGAVRLVDVAPTILDLLQIPYPDHFMGEGLEPVWTGTERTPRQVVAERNNERALVHAGFKYDSNGVLYDLRVDPWGTVDIAAENPEIVERMSALLIDWTGRFAELAAVVRTDGTITLTPEEERRLRALGYLQ
jgi:arylsulfatase A-like enzyme